MSGMNRRAFVQSASLGMSAAVISSASQVKPVEREAAAQAVSLPLVLQQDPGRGFREGMRSVEHSVR